jgi:hypothetical protein
MRARSVAGGITRAFALALLCAGGAGCVEIHGGSVELAWELFTPAGLACCPNKDPCKAAGAGTVRVHLQPNQCNTAELPARRFGCSAVQGATQFDIPNGTYCITVDATNAADVAVAVGPSPILRDVTSGNVVELGAVALTVIGPNQCSTDDSLCP